MKSQDSKLQCWFCYSREQGSHGEIKREPHPDWGMVQVCRLHSPDVNGLNGEHARLKALASRVH
jgi:hypothetical protein